MSGTSNFAGVSFGANTDLYMKEYEKKTCGRWNTSDRVFETCDISVSTNETGCVLFEGSVKEPLRSKLLTSPGEIYVQFWAPSPPDYRTSFSGSGLPFPSEEFAFESSPNIGKVPLAIDGTFRLKLRYPNSYYKRLGAIYVQPSVKLLFRDNESNMIGKVVTVTLGEGIPFRTLSWPKNRNWNRGPMFYCNPGLPIRTQAQILMDSAYPTINKEPSNFWGLRPALPEG
jgi:hypothetical protein